MIHGSVAPLPESNAASGVSELDCFVQLMDDALADAEVQISAESDNAVNGANYLGVRAHGACHDKLSAVR